MDPLVSANNQFALDLYAKLGERAGNLFFSPYSLSTALAMTHAGAGGETAMQMARTLHLTLPPQAQDSAVQALIRHINGDGNPRLYELAVANALWGQSGMSFNIDFVNRLNRHYGASFESVDFLRDAEKARQTINVWVEQKTKEKIPELLKTGTIDSQTELVLTNAIYFKGRWRNAFNKLLTRDDDFFLANGEKAQIPFMQLTEHFLYVEGPDYQALELPYVGDELSLLVVLPKARGGLAKVEQRLSSVTNQKMRSSEIDVTLPRFKMTSGFEMKDVLSKMGMPLAFESGADFSGINGRGGIAISAVIHEAFVDVNEEGTEAAAATGVLMARGAKIKKREPVVFRADHPFVVLIRDSRTGCILFMGRMADPRA